MTERPEDHSEESLSSETLRVRETTEVYVFIFFFDMTMYLLTLLGAMSIIPVFLWKFELISIHTVMIVMLMAPAACWGIGWLHLMAYDFTKSGCKETIKFFMGLISSSQQDHSTSILSSTNLLLAACSPLDQNQLFEGSNSNVASS